MNGVLYVAYGEPARNEAKASIDSLRKFCDYEVAVIADKPLCDHARHIFAEDKDIGARQAKLSMNILSPFDNTLYLDADTRIGGDVSAGFDILDDGWELAIAPSDHQDNDVMWHVSRDDRKATFDAYQCRAILQLQGGVMFFRKCEAIARLFQAWREEWERFKGQDQGALLRALLREPCKCWILGKPWNGGAVVQHLCGRARRNA